MVKHINFNFAKGGPQETSAKSGQIRQRDLARRFFMSNAN